MKNVQQQLFQRVKLVSLSGLSPFQAVSLVVTFNTEGPSKRRNWCKAYVDALWIFLLQFTPGEGSVSIISNRPCPIKVSPLPVNVAFFQPADCCC